MKKLNFEGHSNYSLGSNVSCGGNLYYCGLKVSSIPEKKRTKKLSNLYLVWVPLTCRTVAIQFGRES